VRAPREGPWTHLDLEGSAPHTEPEPDNWFDLAKRREKAIVITAYGSAEGAVEALKAGAFDYLTKPVDLRQFRSVVASALGRGPATPGPRDAAAGGSRRAGR